MDSMVSTVTGSNFDSPFIERNKKAAQAIKKNHDDWELKYHEKAREFNILRQSFENHKWSSQVFTKKLGYNAITYATLCFFLGLLVGIYVTGYGT